MSTLFLTALLATANAMPATAEEVHRFNVAIQEASLAIREFAAQSGLQILVGGDELKGKHLNQVSGEVTIDEGLCKLLEGTGLTHRYIGDRSIALVPARSPVSSKTADESSKTLVRLAQGDAAAASIEDDLRENSKKSSLSSAEEGRAEISEIIVTAQKRAERLVEVPQSVSVLSADDLAKLGATQFRDFADTVPGLSFQTAGPGYTVLTLRGVTTGTGASPTVGIYVDDVPYGSSTGFALGNQLTLDVGLFDLDRIEVLRGPQGTLYGASTMGGLLKYVSRRPDTTRSSVEAQVGLSDTQSGGVNYNISTAVNAPIAADRAALRATAFYSRDGGFIRNLATSDKNVNSANIYGGRADVLLTPSEPLTIRITGFMQDIDRNGQPGADYLSSGRPLFGGLEQTRVIPELFEHQFRLVSGTVAYDTGAAELMSISSYQTGRGQNQGDFTPLYDAFGILTFGGRDFSAGGLGYDVTTDRFTQEIRAVSASHGVLEWVAGGYYTLERSSNHVAYVFRDAAGLPAVNDLLTGATRSEFEEYAAFGDLTWHLTRKLDVTGGARYAQNRQSLESNGSGLFNVNGPLTRSDDDDITYLANARYRFNNHATAYVRYATGYRPGGPNFTSADPNTGLPVGEPTFAADRLKSYEAGLRVQSADRRFGIDIAGYYIDWSNIQIGIFRGGFAAVANAPGGASVRGAELNFTARPLDRLSLKGNVAYQDAGLSEADANLGGAKGEQLPTVPRLTAALNADYELPVDGSNWSVGGTWRFVDDRSNGFKGAFLAPYDLPGYTVVDLRTALALRGVNLQFFVHNLLDERGQISALAAYVDPQRVSLIQPRTIGVMASVRF